MSTILVVDDEDCIRHVLRRFLEGQGHDVLEAADGLEALVVLEEHTVGLAIVDLMMPRMDGLELLRRAQRDFPGTRAVVISALHQDKLDLAGREANVVGLVRKPFEFVEIADALHEALS